MYKAVAEVKTEVVGPAIFEALTGDVDFHALTSVNLVEVRTRREPDKPSFYSNRFDLTFLVRVDDEEFEGEEYTPSNEQEYVEDTLSDLIFEGSFTGMYVNHTKAALLEQEDEEK